MWPYIIIMLFAFAACSIRGAKKRFAYLTVLLIVLFAALRLYTVGWDTAQFAFTYYGRIGHTGFAHLGGFRYEIGYVYLCKLLYLVWPHTQGLIIVSSLIIQLGILRFYFKNADDLGLTLFLYVALNVYADSLNIMRQEIALSLALLGLEYFLKKGKWIKFSAVVLFASLFHKSAIILLVLILLDKIKYSPKALYITFAVSAISLVTADSIYKASNAIFKYGYDDNSTAYYSGVLGASVIFAFSIFILLFAVYCMKPQRFLKNEDLLIRGKGGILTSKVSSSLLLFAACIWCFSRAATINVNLFNRLAAYFVVFIPLLIPRALKYIANSRIRINYKIMTVTVCFIYFAAIELFRPDWYLIVPYRFFWQGG